MKFYLAGKIPSDISIKLDYLVNNDPEDKGLRSEDYTESKLLYKDLRTVLAEVKKHQEKTAC